jgi:phosphatidylserine/phosphatidylglycerophosphate/cardiolipin synthase-like enzyme
MCNISFTSKAISYSKLDAVDTCKVTSTQETETKAKSNLSKDSFVVTAKKFFNINSNAKAVTFSAEKNICIDSANLISTKNKHIDSSTFTSDLSNSKVVMDLDLEITDRNGFNNTGKDDISGKINNGTVGINKDLIDKAVSSIKGYKSTDGNRTTIVKDVKFNEKEKAYVIDIEATQKIPKLNMPLAWDNFKVKFKVDDSGKLVAKLDDNWIPNAIILNKLEGIVKDKIKSNIPKEYQNLKIEVKKEANKLVLVPDIKELEVPIASKAGIKINHIDGEKAKFTIDDKGNIKIKLNNVAISGSSALKGESSKTTDKPDQAQISLKLAINKDDKREVYAKGKVKIDLDENETKSVKLGNESLGNYFKEGKILTDFSLHLTQKGSEKPTVEAKNYVYIQDAKLGDQKVNLATSLSLNFDKDTGITLDAIEEKQAPININTSENGVELFINGATYFPEMKNMINKAKESIDLETYMFHNDSAGNSTAYLLAKKAAGLEAQEGKPDIVANSANGVKVRVIFNSWQGKLDHGKESEEVFTRAMEKVKSEIHNSKLPPDQKEKAIENLEKNLKYKFFTDGILRSDHRKVFVVDGLEATVGGMNMGSQYLSTDAYHDVMLKIAGPEVRNVHKEFVENWFEFNNLPQPSKAELDSMLKSDTELKNSLAQLQNKGNYSKTSKVGVLVTDDHQTDIEKGILKLIDEAKKEINIEQAFFSSSKINTHLKEAMKKGVKVNVIVAKHSLIDIFDSANLNSVYELVKTKKQGAKGDISFFYYDKNAHEGKHIHTKAISVDGEKAIIGSANMIGRSLNSPFQKINNDGSTAQTMYNKELSLYVEDKKMVNEIDSRLFQEDQVNNAKEIPHSEIEVLVKKAGGESELKKKALIATFT